MKIFSPPETNIARDDMAVKGKSKSKKRMAGPLKSDISEKEIREKLASHVETSNTAKSKVLQKNSQALGAGFLNEDKISSKIQTAQEGKKEGEVKEDSLKDSHLLLSDVKLNDPNDSNTQEKLKTVLKTGAFNFNPREKETLEKILAGN